MERNEEFAYGRGDILYMAGGTIAAIGDALGHRWARYLDKDLWDDLKSPEAVAMRAKWLKVAHKFVEKGDRGAFIELLEESWEKLPELRNGFSDFDSEARPFYLKGKNAEQIYDLVAVIGHSATPQTTYLDLVMGIDPVVRRMSDVWSDQEEGGRRDYRFREPPPPPISDEAKRALEEGVLDFLVKHTYVSLLDIRGIDSPNVRVEYAKEYEERGAGNWTDKVERNIAHLRYGHTTGTGRGEFSVSYADGVYDFHFRVVRGGEHRGLTAIETHVRIVDKDLHHEGLPSGVDYRITPLAEERHYIYATEVLRAIGESMEKYAIDVPYEINPAVEKIKTLADIMKEEYEVKFGPFPEEGEREFCSP